ncbi:MAG: ABC-2 family transporter protein [Acidimicrobiia bacterium]|nr:ABC-2 family transporter protein [Acidimicrobiia bacterium]
MPALRLPVLVAGRPLRQGTLLLVVAQVFVTATELAAIAVIFGQVDPLAGWTLEEVALLYGLSGLAFGVADLFVSQAELASQHMHDPEILFLDEPTIGLDLVSRESVRTFLRQRNRERGTSRVAHHPRPCGRGAAVRPPAHHRPRTGHRRREYEDPP